MLIPATLTTYLEMCTHCWSGETRTRHLVHVINARCFTLTSDHMVSHSHIHVVNAQLAVEMLADVATKPDRLRKTQQWLRLQ